MATIPTIRVKNPAEPGAFFTINASDFDESKHEKFVAAQADVIHVLVPTLEEYVAAGYSADSYARRFWNQKAGDVFNITLDNLPKPPLPSEAAPADGVTNTPEASVSGAVSQAITGASDAAPAEAAPDSINTPSSSAPPADGERAKKGPAPKRKGARG